MTDIQVAHRSYSQLTSWLRCGHAYHLERIAKVEQIPAWWFVGGKAVHTATEVWDLALEEGTEPDADGIWQAAWEKELAEELDRTTVPMEDWRAGGRRTKDKPDKENGIWWEQAGRGFLQNWIDFRNTYPNWKIATMPDGRLGIEVEYNVWFGEVPVRAFIDRVFDVVGPGGVVDRVVLDLKTGSTMPKTAQQNGMYASCIELAHGPDHRPALGCFWDARKGDITVPEMLDNYSVASFTDMLERFNRAVLERIFIPNIGQACGSCGVARFCAAVSGELAATVDPS